MMMSSSCDEENDTDAEDESKKIFFIYLAENKSVDHKAVFLFIPICEAFLLGNIKFRNK